MKRIAILGLFFCLFHFCKSQTAVLASKWDNPTVFENSSPPIIKRYGKLSDSLSSAYGIEFYFYNDKYFPIRSWADYYYWYTQKYWHFFPTTYLLYEFYYQTGFNIGMAKIIAGDTYLGSKYPSFITLNFANPYLGNRLKATTTSDLYSDEDFERENFYLKQLAQNRDVSSEQPVKNVVRGVGHKFIRHSISSEIGSSSPRSVSDHVSGSHTSSGGNGNNPEEKFVGPDKN